MLIGQTRPTAADLNFRLLGVQVRIHPMFWILMILLGTFGHNSEPAVAHAGAWVFAALITILLHEFAHALMAMAFGSRDLSICLHGLGGVTFGARGNNALERILISAAGPGSNLVLGAFLGMGALFNSVMGYEVSNFFLDLLLNTLFMINIFWGILNLLPVFPMDGGQIMAEVFMAIDSDAGRRWTHRVSIALGCLVALVGFRLGGYFLTLIFCYLAYMNYRYLRILSLTDSGS